MIKGIAHICIGAYDLQQTEDFYCRIMGLKKVFSFKKNDEIAGFYLNAGNNTFIEIFPEKNQFSGTQQVRHFCLEVDNLDKFIASVRKKGWDISDKARASAGNWQCWANDPNGVKLEFHEYTEDCSQKTGKDCQVKW